MNSMCFETFESVRTTFRLRDYKGVSNELEVLNLLEPLVDCVNLDYKLVSHEFNVFGNI